MRKLADGLLVLAEKALVPPLLVALRVIAVKVADACPHNGGFEALRLSDRPGHHKAAIAPAHDTHAFPIDLLAFNQILDAAQSILKVFAAHIAQYRIGKGHA